MEYPSSLGRYFNPAGSIYPPRRTSVGDRAFAVAESRAWNALPAKVRDRLLAFSRHFAGVRRLSHLFQIGFRFCFDLASSPFLGRLRSRIFSPHSFGAPAPTAHGVTLILLLLTLHQKWATSKSRLISSNISVHCSEMLNSLTYTFNRSFY